MSNIYGFLKVSFSSTENIYNYNLAYDRKEPNTGIWRGVVNSKQILQRPRPENDPYDKHFIEEMIDTLIEIDLLILRLCNEGVEL